jgi:hypothetical protein
VLSHWLLDVLVHGADMTILGGAPKFGLGLWNHPAIEMPLEIGITLGALWLYASAHGGRRLSLFVLAALLLILQAVNWFGAEPTEVTAGTSLLAFFAFGVLTLAAWWTDRGGKLSMHNMH